MDEITKKLIAEKKFSDLEDRWIELMEDPDIKLKELFEIAQELKKHQEDSRAFMLLALLAENLILQGKMIEAIEVYKNMAYFTNDDSKIREDLIKLYQNIYKESVHIDDFIELSGLKKGGHIFKSLNKLDEFLRYDKGNIFYFEKFGIGEVVEIRPEKREIILNFERQKGYLLKIDVAQRLLKPVPPGHFLYKKYKSISELKTLAKEDPIGLTKFLLRSFNVPLSSSQIKLHLKGVIEDEVMDKFWEKIKKRLETDPEIEIIGETKRLYQYIPEVTDKVSRIIKAFEEADINKKYYLAEEYLKKKPDVFEKLLSKLIDLGDEHYRTYPWFAVDLYYLCRAYNKDIKFSYTLEGLINNSNVEEIVLKLNNDDHKRYFLQEIVEKRPSDWLRVMKKIYLSADVDFKLLAEIEKHLARHTEELKEMYQTIFLMPQKFPGQFQWLLKKVARGELSEFINSILLPRLINSLEYVKGIKKLFLKILPLDKFDELIKTAPADNVRNIKSAITESTCLTAYEKNNFLRIIDFYFPGLFEKKEEAIYATPEALTRKKQELEHLLTVEIPVNKKEISKAREYGDLSENFEYKAAKEKQDQLYQRVREIEAALSKVKIIDLTNVDTSKVSIGTTVVLKNLNSGEITNYTILGRWDTNLDKNIISNEAPLARDILLGRTRGERVIINEVPYEVIDIKQISS